MVEFMVPSDTVWDVPEEDECILLSEPKPDTLLPLLYPPEMLATPGIPTLTPPFQPWLCDQPPPDVWLLPLDEL